MGECAPRGAGGGRWGRVFSHPMADVEVCVVAWLAWGVVAGLWGVVWDGSGAVLGPFGKVLDKPF